MCGSAFTAHGFRCRVRVEPDGERWIAWVEFEPIADDQPPMTAIRPVSGSYATEEEARAAAEVYAKVVAFSGLKWQ
jgi:hypothetical protein